MNENENRNEQITDENEIRKIVGSNQMRLTSNIQSGDIDEDNRTVAVTFSSEEPVKRNFGIEILDHNPDSVDMSRLLDGAPVLEDHGGGPIGVVEDATIREDKKGFALLRFSKNPKPTEIFNDIVAGIRKNISVGYKITGLTRQEGNEGDETTFRASWFPHEISVVGIPADNMVGIGRSYENEKGNNMPEENKTEDKPVERDIEKEIEERVNAEIEKRKTENKPKIEVIKMTDEDNKRAIDEAVATAKKDELSRLKEVTAIAQRAGFTADEVNELAASNITIGDMQGKAIDKMHSAGERVATIADPLADIPEKDKRKYDFGSVIRGLISGKLDGLEREISEEMQLKSSVAAGGCMVPYFAMEQERALEAGSSPGSNLVGTDHRGDLFIEKLRNSAKVMQLGATSLNGLQGNVAIPRQTGAVTIASLAEAAAITPSDSNFDQVTLSPKRVGGSTIYSKQLLLQSNPSIDNLVRNDITTEIMLDIDAKALQGSGAANQPTGIENQAGINTVTFTTAPTWAKVVEFETAIATDNANVDSMAYLSTAAVRGAWKTTVKEAGQATYLWEMNNSPVNGYNAEVSNQIAGDLVFFGDWSQLLLGFWGGIDLIVDEITLAGNAQIQIYGNAFFDVAVRHPESFTVSTDAGNI